MVFLVFCSSIVLQYNTTFIMLCSDIPLQQVSEKALVCTMRMWVRGATRLRHRRAETAR